MELGEDFVKSYDTIAICEIHMIIKCVLRILHLWV